MTATIKLIIPIFLTAIFTVLILQIGTLSNKIGVVVSDNDYISWQFSYQLVLLAITGFSILASFFLNKTAFLNYFSFGHISAPAQESKPFGISQGDSWTKTGISLCIVISLVTAIVMYFQLKKANVDWSNLQNGILWVLLFSLTNSFAEEMIYRVGLVSPLTGVVQHDTIFLISAIMFGLAHFQGMPNGIIGMTMAGILGYVLAKSVYETNGFFWAWTIHFLQDVIIIGSLYLMKSAYR